MPADPLPHPSATIHHPTPTGFNLPRGGTGSPPPPSALSALNSPTALHHPSALHGPNATPPKAGPINKLRGSVAGPGQGTPKDTIPISKTPRKQRSSRFHVADRVQLQPLPSLLDAHPQDRHDLFIQKLRQASVIFDFNDVSTDLEGKNIKTQALQEMLEFISTQKGVITEDIYPEVVKMVRTLAKAESGR